MSNVTTHHIITEYIIGKSSGSLEKKRRFLYEAQAGSNPLLSFCYEFEVDSINPSRPKLLVIIQNRLVAIEKANVWPPEKED